MIEKIRKIREKLKSNKQCVGIGFTNIDDFINIEDFLLKNKYFWNGRNDSTCLHLHQYNDIRINGLCCIHINYCGNSTLTYATGATFYYECDIFLNKDNIYYFKKNLFMDEPNYNPRKKIIRELP